MQSVQSHQQVAEPAPKQYACLQFKTNYYALEKKNVRCLRLITSYRCVKNFAICFTSVKAIGDMSRIHRSKFQLKKMLNNSSFLFILISNSFHGLRNSISQLFLQYRIDNIYYQKMSKYKRSFILDKQNQSFYDRPTTNINKNKSAKRDSYVYTDMNLSEITNGINHRNQQEDSYQQYASPLVKPFTINMQSTKKLSLIPKRPVQNQQVDFDDESNYKYDKYDKIQLKQFKQNLRLQHVTNTKQSEQRENYGNDHKRESAKRIQFQSKINNIQKIGTQIDSLLDYFKNGTSKSKIIQKQQVQVSYAMQKSLSPYRKLQQNVLNSSKSRPKTPTIRQNNQHTPRNRTAMKPQRQRLYELSPLNRQKYEKCSFSNQKSPNFDFKREETQLKGLLGTATKNRAHSKAPIQVQESIVRQHEQDSNTDLQFYFESLKKLQKQGKQSKQSNVQGNGRTGRNYDYSNYKETNQAKNRSDYILNHISSSSLKYSEGQAVQKDYHHHSKRPFLSQNQIQIYKDIRMNQLKKSQLVMKDSLTQSQSLSKIQKIKSKYLKDGYEIQEQDQSSSQYEKKPSPKQNQSSYRPSRLTYNFKKQSQKKYRQQYLQKNTPQYRNQQNKYKRYEANQIRKQPVQYGKNELRQIKNIAQQQKKVDTGKIDNQIMKIKQKLEYSKEQKHILRKKYEQIINQQQGVNSKISIASNKTSRTSITPIKKNHSQSKIKYIQKSDNSICGIQATAVKNSERFYDQERICQKQMRKFEDDQRTIVNNILPQNSYQKRQKKDQFKIKLQRVQITKHQITKLAALLAQQIQIDQKLRSERQKFCMIKNTQKWQKLSQELKKQDITVSAQSIQKLLLITSEEHNPFDLAPIAGLSLQTQIHSIKQRYIQAQKNYKQKIVQSISKQNLQKQNFSLKDLDLSSKGYLSIEDLVCFINLYTGRFYRNRDIIFIVKRLLHNHNISIQKQDNMKIQFEDIMNQFTH